MNKTHKLINQNKDLIIKNKKLSYLLNNKNSSSNNNSTNSSSNNIMPIHKTNNSNNLKNSKSRDKQEIKNNVNQNTNKSKNINRNGSFSKILDNKEDKFKNINKDINNNMNPNYNTTNNIKNVLQIKIANSVLKKDITGKPFLDYICEVKNGKQNYSLNKKFGHFIMLHKSLKTTFKDNVKLPNGGNLFININEMRQNSFQENKLEQLDKYVSELLNIEQVRNSTPFKSFFELDEQHEQKLFDNNLGNYRLSMEQKKNNI